MIGAISNERLMRILNATPQQHEAIDRILAGKPEAAPEPPRGPLLMRVKGRKRTSADALQAAGVVALTKTQMAAALQISVRTLNGMMAREEIAYFKIGRRLVRFRAEEALARMSETCGRGEARKRAVGGLGVVDG